MQDFIRRPRSRVGRCDEPAYVAPAVSRFPRTTADARAATPRPGDESTRTDHRVATVAVRAVLDGWLRSFRIPGATGTGPGCRAGRSPSTSLVRQPCRRRARRRPVRPRRRRARTQHVDVRHEHGPHARQGDRSARPPRPAHRHRRVRVRRSVPALRRDRDTGRTQRGRPRPGQLIPHPGHPCCTTHELSPAHRARARCAGDR